MSTPRKSTLWYFADLAEQATFDATNGVLDGDLGFSATEQETWCWDAGGAAWIPYSCRSDRAVADGYASKAGRVFRFTNRTDSPDGLIAWTDDGTGTFGTILRDGTYQLELTGWVATNATAIAVCGGAALSGTWSNVGQAGQAETTLGGFACPSATVALSAGDVVWTMSEGSLTTLQATSYFSRFTVTRISNVGP
jgi:hypothetical protein